MAQEPVEANKAVFLTNLKDQQLEKNDEMDEIKEDIGQLNHLVD